MNNNTEFYVAYKHEFDMKLDNSNFIFFPPK